MMTKSLYGKLIIFTIGVMVTSFIVAFLTVNTFYHQKLKEQNDEKNVTIAKEIVSYIEEHHPISIDDYFSSIASTGYKIIVVNTDDETTFYGDSFRKHNLSTNAIDKVLQGETYHGMRDFPKETFVTGFFADETANTVGVPFSYKNMTYGLFIRPNIKLLFTEIHYLLGGMLVVMGIVSIIGMLVFAGLLIRPIIKLKEATKKISTEQFPISLPIQRNDELGQLANSFQEMAEQLHASNEMRKQFINDVSHDFQTPLQNIKGYAHLLEDKNISDENLQLYTNIIQKETTRLSNLTNQLLFITSLDSMNNLVNKKRVHITEQIKAVIQKYRWLLEEKNISTVIHMEDVTIIGDATSLEKIWDNLLSNAIKYNVDGGFIDISLWSDAGDIYFIIRDKGIGIASSDIPHLFDRFFRTDHSRNSTIPGTGLGLSIVKQIVELHGGKIDVHSVIDIGSSFTITLPKNFHL